MQGWMLGAPVPCDAEGYRRNDCSTLAPDEIGDSLSVSLYTVPEIARTVQVRNPCFDTPFCLPFFHLKPRQARDKCNEKNGRFSQEFNRTAANALAHNKSKVVPYICLGCGYQRDVLYPYGGSSLFSATWCGNARLLWRRFLQSETIGCQDRLGTNVKTVVSPQGLRRVLLLPPRCLYECPSVSGPTRALRYASNRFALKTQHSLLS
jgi:hypothetical protein